MRGDDPDGAGTGHEILIVDDSRTQRVLLRALLAGLGYRVVEAESGQEALEILREREILLLLCDWMMPGLTGPEVCAALRERQTNADARPYVVLLTARQDRGAIAKGLAAGADDFLTKPVDRDELSARLLAGRRILAMQARLIEQRDEITAAYAELSGLHEILDRDLRVASHLQAEFVPPAATRLNGAPCAALCRAARHVGGDLVGHFAIGAEEICVFSVDVSGHGVAAALRAAHLAQLLSVRDLRASLALAADGTALDPAETVSRLNARFEHVPEHDVYFTIAIAVVDLATGRTRVCSAGHPPPIVLSADAAPRFLELGNPPVGLLRQCAYQSEETVLAPGDRLLLHSDGLTEAQRRDGTQIDGAGLARLLADQARLPADELLPTLLCRLETEIGQNGFEDDISAVLVERPAG